MWELIVVGAVVLGGVGLYNSLVKLREMADAAWADIDVQLKRRYDLIPNIVETVKGYASHEQKTLEAVVQARSSAMSAQGPAQKGQAEGMLTGALKSLFALSEAYPDLKADRNFLQLQTELVNTEDRIQAARRFYNGNVRDYRNLREGFPSNLIANMFSFEQSDFFNVAPAVRKAPSVAGSFQAG